MVSQNRYAAILEKIFQSLYKKGIKSITFHRSSITEVANSLGITPPKNLGDLIYSFRYRNELPTSIADTAPDGMMWIIRPAGTSKYQFVLIQEIDLEPRANLSKTKIPDSTPSIVGKHSLSDEQALLARVRYNRLIDIFSGAACFSLQNHLRTTVPKLGQVETDEIYVGIDKSGSQFVFPVQAKGGKDKLSVVQIEQDFAMCELKFPGLICRPIGARFLRDDVIALLEFELEEDEVRIAGESHYKLVLASEISATDLKKYKERLKSQLK